MKREVRYVSELRAADGDGFVLQGYAALFNSESKDLGGFRETIAPGAFTRSLADNADVKCLFNHDPNHILGRSKSGTLSLKQDERGLAFTCQLDKENQNHRDLYASVKRGDIDECSFAFTVASGGQAWAEKKDKEGNAYVSRTLTEVNLMDVSAVTYPAYNDTSVAARNLFPDGEIMEIRSAIESVKQAAQATEKRTRAESLEQQLYEKQGEILEALLSKFGFDDFGRRKFYLVETYDDHIIACSYNDEYEPQYVSISYKIDGKDADGDDNYVLGEPAAVELDWVPAERSKKLEGEFRAAHKAAKAAKEAAAAPQQRAHSQEHEEGDCADPECACQNRTVSIEDVFDDADEGVDADNQSATEDEDEDDERTATPATETRASSEKTLTKLVDGKNLPASKFAFVGDPKKTETWKLPIHDADHVRNALARFNQTKGIPADQKKAVYDKILAAAKKFGIHVSDEDSRSVIQSLPYDADDIRKIKARLAKAMM